MTFDLVKVLTRTTSSETTATRNIVSRGHHSTHGHSEHHKHAPLPFLASPVNPEALTWVRNKKHNSSGIQRARTVAQYDAEHIRGKSESALAHRIFRKQHEASTLELFFDLFFVGNLAVFTTKSSHVDLQSLSNYIGFFTVLWSTWFHISMFDVRFYVDSVFTRICKFVAFGIMVSLVGLTQLYEAILSNGMSRSFQGIALVLFGARWLWVIQYTTILYFVREFDKTLVPLLLTMFVYVVASFGFLATWLEERGQSSLRGDHGARHVYIWYGIVGAEAIAIIVVSSIWRVLSFKHTHLVERVGLLTLIVMGEGIIGLIKSTSYAIQGTEVTVWQESGILAAAVLLIYLMYVLYFDNIDHHRFGSIGQQIWTLLHFPAHVAILLTVEGSSALIIWNACRAAIAWIIEDTLPSISDPAHGFATAVDFLDRINSTYFQTSTRYYYYELSDIYTMEYFTDDLSKLNNTKSPYATSEWTLEVRPTLQKMRSYYEYFVYQNFGAEGPDLQLDLEADYGKKVQLYEDGFKFTVMYFYIAAGALLFILAFLYWFGRKSKTRTEWVSIGVRILAGMGLPLMVISPLMEERGDDDAFRFRFAALLIPIVALALLVVILVDGIVKAVSERHWDIVKERRMSRGSTYMSQSQGKELEDSEREMMDEDSSYEMQKARSRYGGSPELVNSELVMKKRTTLDDDDTAPLTRNAQRTPTVTFGGVSHHRRHSQYAEIGQDADDEEIAEYRGGEPLGHFRSQSLRRH